MRILCYALMGTVIAHSLCASAFGQVRFERAFAPQQGLVTRYEQPARAEICLNGAWRFRATDDTAAPGDSPAAIDAWDAVPIKVPSPWNVNSFCMTMPVQGGDFIAFPSYPKSWEQAKAAWMETSVTIPREWSGKRVVLHFGAVAGKMTVYVNGQRAGESFDLFFPHEFDVTDLIRAGEPNVVCVHVIAANVFDKPGKFGAREYLAGSFWGTHISGIWQDVFLLALPEVSIADVFVQPWVDRDELTVEATLVNRGDTTASVNVSGSVREWINQTGKSVLEIPEINWTLADASSLDLPAQQVTLQPLESRKVVITAKVNQRLKPWTPDAPNLYGLLLELSSDGKPIDTKYQRFGWRQFTLGRDRLHLNGNPITLKGDSWHFMGVQQMTRRYAFAWYTLLKDAGANAVRTHASVFPPFYYDVADEMGILVLDETAIWLSDGASKGDSELFWSNCRKHVEMLVRRDRNHPSVFGWSICNEILPVIQTVWNGPRSMTDHCLNEMTAWSEIVRRHDPTRAWISGDGEWDADGRLPVINLHYGGVGDMQRGAASGKPWGVGETSMAYYGTPKQVAEWNGNRAYGSVLGRMEGLALECYHLLREQQKHNACYQSVFNIAWYAVKPLPLGKRDLTKPITSNEGIIFGPYREGVPGMQPERLGPYCTTLNPGYDPNLPLYDPWPMFEAICDANHQRAESKWANRPTIVQNEASGPVTATGTLHYLPGNGAKLAEELEKVGVKVSSVATNIVTDKLVIDASDGATFDASLKLIAQATLDHGGTVWIWNITPDSAKSVGELLDQQVLTEPFAASSFIVRGKSPLVAGLDNARLYFCEDDDWKQMTHGLGGEFVARSEIALEACPADWRQWNYQPEPVKTAAVYRSELERAGPRAAVVVCSVGRGRVVLCNLTPTVNSSRKLDVIERLMLNEGIAVQRAAPAGTLVDVHGRLTRALVCGSFDAPDSKIAYADTLDLGEAREGTSLSGRTWTAREINAAGVFDFNEMDLDGPRTQAAAILLVRIKSSKPLNELLAEPNQPRVSLAFGADDGCQVWLNGKCLATHERVGPHVAGMFRIDALPLKLGWNELAFKVVQVSGEWKFSARFDCTDRRFVQSLEFALEAPKAD